MMRKHGWRFGFAVLGAALLTACGDQSSSPLGPRNINGAFVASDTTVSVFTVGPWGGKYNVGATHRIEFPAGAICDLLTSSYGPSQWDAPCVASALPVRITAKTWTDAAGHPQVDFSPAMRFSPTLREGVVLYLKDKRSAVDPDAKIFYCGGNSGTSCVDESVTDASLTTRFDAPNGFVYRRIKHFSGYNVTARATTTDIDVAVEVLP